MLQLLIRVVSVRLPSPVTGKDPEIARDRGLRPTRFGIPLKAFRLQRYQRMTARTFLLLSTLIVLPACSVVSAAGTAVGTAASVAGSAVRTTASVAGSVASGTASAASSAIRGSGDAAASDKTAPAEAAKH